MKRICVVGAGPSGLAVLKVLSETPYFKSSAWSVTAFEAKEDISGVWLPAPPTGNPPLTPLYDSLTTNAPHPFMSFSDYPFPPSTALYPTAETVLKYLNSYADHFNLLPFIQLKTVVTNARWDGQHWAVTTSIGEIHEFDNLVVANGHHRVPHVTEIPGVEFWMKTGKASHSAWHRRPKIFGRKVLVVGGGPSGQDISNEMRLHATTVIHSLTGGTPDGDQFFKRVGRTLHFYEDGSVLFEGGIIETDIDYCILATGYKMDFPFFGQEVIRTEPVPAHPPLPVELYNSTYHVFPLAKFLFPLQTYYPTSSLAFVALLKMAPSMPTAEAQAHAIVRVFADPGSLNHQLEAEKIIERSQKFVQEGASTPTALAKAWMHFQGTENWDYQDELYTFAAESGDGPRPAVHDREKAIWTENGTLREAWKDLERRGKASEWVDGVGKGGMEEWLDMMERLLKHAKEGAETGFGQNQRLFNCVTF